MNKYYHRGSGEVVLPETHPFFKESIPQQRAEIIASLPVYAHCSPDLPVGWFEGREVKQLQNANKTYWGECSDFVFDIANDNVRRIWIEPVAETNKVTVRSEKSVDLSNAKFVEMNYEQEAREFYPFDNDDDCWNEKQQELRAAHIKARQMAEQEIRELVQALKDIRKDKLNFADLDLLIQKHNP